MGISREELDNLKQGDILVSASGEEVSFIASYEDEICYHHKSTGMDVISLRYPMKHWSIKKPEPKMKTVKMVKFFDGDFIQHCRSDYFHEVCINSNILEEYEIEVPENLGE